MTSSGPDWSLILSSVALLVSIATFVASAYWEHFQRPRPSLFAEGPVSLGYGSRKELLLYVPVTVLNDGARNGVLRRVVGEVSQPPGGLSGQFAWRSFQRSEDVGEPGTTSRRVLSFVGWARPLVVAGRGAVNELVQFKTSEPFVVAAGRCRVTMRALVAGAKGTASAEFEVDITEDDARFLAEKCQVDDRGIAQHSLVKYV